MKKYILLPIALLIYLAFIAYFSYPGRSVDGGVGYTQYYITIGVTVLIIIALSFFLRKKEQNKKKHIKK